MRNFVLATGVVFCALDVAAQTCGSHAVLVQPESVQTQGAAPATLQAIVKDATATSYQWFEGPSGDTSKPLGITTDTASVTPLPVGTTPYWVRVTSECGTRDSVNAYVAPAACPEPPPVAQLNGPFHRRLCNRQPYTASVGANPPGTEYRWSTSSMQDARILSGDGTPSIQFEVDLGESYTMKLRWYAVLRIDARNSCGSRWTDFVFLYGDDPANPAITAPGNVQPGQPAAASVQPTFTYPFHNGMPSGETYAWSISNGTIVSGQGTPSITFTSASGGSLLTATITNACGSASATKSVTSCTAPQVTEQPQGSTVRVGEEAVLRVGYASDSHATVQWYRGASGDSTDPLTGENGTDLVVRAKNGSESYWARVDNACGTDASQTAVVTGVAPPPGRRRSARS